MNDSEINAIETELRKMKPASLPEVFRQRLLTCAQRARHPSTMEVHKLQSWRGGAAVWTWWRRLIPAAALVMAALLIWSRLPPDSDTGTFPSRVYATTGMNADAVEIESRLVNEFDAVTSLPEGEPVRFRYEEWVDELTLRDSVRGLVMQKRSPRVEIFPLGFETD